VLRMSAEILALSADECASCDRSGPFGDNCFNADRGRSLALGSVQPFGLYRHMECQCSFQHRHRDVDTASGWLITSIDPNPMMVSLVQVAVSLRLFLFTLPAGALADVLDSRRLLIAVETAILAVSVIFAGLVSIGLAAPTLLLATTFLLGVGGAHVACLGRHPAHARAEGGS
jgi:hypothetical protein